MLKVAVLTRRGLLRVINQDRVVVNNTVVASELSTTAVFTSPLPGLVAVLDGLGGHPGGDIASSLAADVIASGSSRVKTGRDMTALLDEANRHLYRVMFAYPSLEEMGTTVAGVLVTADTVTVFHVGDSRVYLHTGDEMVQATVDDSEDGYITQTLGGYSSFQPMRVHTTSLPLGDGRILAATDGLFGRTDRSTLSQAMGGPIEAVPEQLSEVAIRSRNPDDVSVVAVERFPSRTHTEKRAQRSLCDRQHR